MNGGEWKMESGGWRMEDGGQRIEGERWRMKEGGRPWEEWEAGLWLLLLCSMGALLKHVQVQAGKERGEFMEGTAGLIPHCLPTPAARNAQDPGSSFPAVALRRAVHSISSTSGLYLARVHSRGVPRTSRGASPQTCGLCRGIPPPALPAVSAASLPSLVKTPTIPFLGLIPPVPGKNRRPFPSPQPFHGGSEQRDCLQGYSPCSGCLQMAFQDSPSSGHALPSQLLPCWRGTARPCSAGARLLNLLSQEHTSPQPARRYYCAGWGLLSLLLLPESSP